MNSFQSEAPSCYYNPVEYNPPHETNYVGPDTIRHGFKRFASDTHSSVSPASTSADNPTSLIADLIPPADESVFAQSQRGLIMFPTRETKQGTQKTPIIGEVKLICMQNNGMDQEKKLEDGESVLYNNVTLGIYTQMPDEASTSKGTYHLEIAKHMDVTLTKTDGRLTLDAKSREIGSFANLDNRPVWHGQKVFKHDGAGNSLIWKDRFSKWVGIGDVTNEKATDLWREWSRPSLLVVSAGKVTCGETVIDASGSMRSVEEA